MEGIHSYEQRSSSELGQELNAKQNRVIIVNRREPKVGWSMPDQPQQQQSDASCGLMKYVGSLCSACWFCRGNRRHSARIQSTSSSSIATDHYDLGPYPSNEWITSKYTLLNFLPKNLFEQFRRLANFYFLIIALLQIFIPFSPVGPTTSLLPLVFVVSTSSIKQAYEDYLRHKLDREMNNRLCYILRGQSLVKIRSKDIRVGDFVYVKNNEEIPCDMVLLAASGNGDRCYITTANLDGETSLKSRSCYHIREQVGPIEQLNKSLLVVECERPNATLYEFSGFLKSPKTDNSYQTLVDSLRTNTLRTVAEQPMDQRSQAHAIIRRIYQSTQRSSGVFPHMSDYHDIPLDINNLLLRASRLRNTTYVYGLAVYTGNDTKLAHNSQVKPNKFSSTERKVNNFLIIAFVILLLFTAIGTLTYRPQNRWLFEGLTKGDSFQKIFIAHFLIYNYLVPISLYVTLEFIKFFGTLSVIGDKHMKVAVWQSVVNGRVMSSKESADTKSRSEFVRGMDSLESAHSSGRKIKVIESPKCNSSDLNEELGQVEVLFSDKTGTLTENQMQFMACSVQGQLYRAVRNNLYLQPSELFIAPIPSVVHQLAKVKANRHSYLTPSVASHKLRASDLASAYQSRAKKSASRKFKPFDHRYVPPLGKLKLAANLDQRERVAEFFICLCLCSTITLNETLALADCLPDKPSAEYDFQSASPDEESLITAAHLYGITMCKSSDRECFIVIRRTKISHGHLDHVQYQRAPPTSKSNFRAVVEGKFSTSEFIVRHFERLLVFEFSSLRKRMSVVYRDCDNDCYLMVSKGSEEMLDCINLNELDAEQERAINATLAHSEAFAMSGLRTLLVARRVISRDEFDLMESGMKEARLSLQNRDHMMNRLYQQSEVDLRLIGTTAVEDTLQNGVPETIANLKEAGIKVWLLTGDKVETAVSVAYLCKLLDRDMILLHLTRQQDLQTCQKLLAAYLQQVEAIRDGERRGKSERSAASQTRKSAASKTSSSRISADTTSQSHVSLQMSTTGALKSSTGSLSSQQFALISDGRSLYYVMKYAKDDLAKLCKECTCVLGCRLSPLQKAEVVDMIKQSREKPITAAIGDGANDVAMIQEAHVGIGISGREGRQAVNSSDFGISRFHLLNRLFFIHGHLFYHRTANTILYFFYKNLLFILPQFIYSTMHNLSSAQSLYHPLALVGYNLFFTSLPILIYGLSEIHIPETVLENYPKLYSLNRANSQLRMSVFLTWQFVAALQASIGFYLLYFIWGNHAPFVELSKSEGNTGFSLMLYLVLIFTATLHLVFLSKHHSSWFMLSALGSCLMVPLVFYGYSLVHWKFNLSDNAFHGQLVVYLGSLTFWLAVFSTTAATLIPDLIWYARDRMMYLRRLNGVMNTAASAVI